MTNEQKAIALLEKLTKANVPYLYWGSRLKGYESSRTFKHLLDEILSHEATISLHYTNVIYRVIRVLLLDIFYFDNDSDTILYLKEEKQMFDDGRVITRQKSSSVSEKMLATEHIETAGISRALKEELEIEGRPIFVGTDVLNEIRDSKSYPGIKTSSENHRYSIFLTDNQYKKEGYIERLNGITTYFIWTKYEPPVLEMVTIKRADND